MISRRQFLKTSLIMAGGILLSSCTEESPLPEVRWSMPEESHPHLRTWMAFVASEAIWSKKQIPEVQENLATIAKTIAKYEPVNLLVSEQDRPLALELLGDLNSQQFPIKLLKFATNDLWLRDTGPTFVLNQQGQAAAIDFNFNGWGNKQTHDLDAKVAEFIAQQSQKSILNSSLVLEGGCFECDGEGTAIMTESCILNDNRNPGKTKAEIETELKQLLGLKKIIWLKGVKGKDITDGHTDFYARFAKPGVVIMSRDTDMDSYDYDITRQNIKNLQGQTDAKGRPLEILILDTPMEVETRFGLQDFAAGYVGYYVCNGAVIMQTFGDQEADKKAKETLTQAFPQHMIETVRIDGIASGGGSIHCATQQEPK